MKVQNFQCIIIPVVVYCRSVIGVKVNVNFEHYVANELCQCGLFLFCFYGEDVCVGRDGFNSLIVSLISFPSSLVSLVLTLRVSLSFFP